MPDNTEALGELYQEITGEESVTESQEEEPSREAISDQDADLENEVQDLAQKDGLSGAVEGAETEQAA
jgi:hypothetical protein